MVNFLITKSKELINKKSSSILSAAGIIGLSYLGSALLGLVRNHLLAARFFGGLEADLDVYFAAFIIPDTIFQLLVVGAVSASFIPIYQEHFNKSEKEANYLANVALTTVSFVLIIFSILTSVFARPLAGLLANYPPQQLDLMANLIRIMSIAQVLFTFSSFFTGILQSHQRFLIPAIAPIMYNLGTIIGIFFLSPYLGIYSAAIGVLIGSFLHAAIQLPSTLHLGYRPKFIFDFKNKGVRQMLKLMPPRTLSLGLDQFERAISVNLTSILSAGSLSIFNFARQLYILPVSLFGISLSQATFPSLSLDATNDDKTKFKNTLSKSIMQIFFFAFPASVLILVLRIPLVRLAFGAKSFPWDATLLTGKALAILAVSVAPQAVTHTLTRGLHALKDTKTPLISGIITMILFVIPAYVTTRVFDYGVLGITFSIAFSNTIDFLLLYIFMRRQIGGLNIFFKTTRIAFVSAITGLALWVPLRLLDQLVFDTTRTFPLILLTLTVASIGFLVYIFFCWIFKVEELSDILHLINKIGNWRKILVSSDEVLETTPSE